MRGSEVVINGDGETSRDFCYVANAVQANVLAALAPALPAGHEAFNVAVGERTTLNQLFGLIRERVARVRAETGAVSPRFAEFRAGDVRHSLADVGKAGGLLGYAPTHRLGRGLDAAMGWYLR